MNCQDARRLLHHVLDDDITLPAKRQLESHLQACSSCRNVESSLDRLTTALEQLADVSVPQGFTAHVMQQLQPVRTYTSFFSRMRGVCAAALLFLLLATPVFVWSTLSSPQLVADDRQVIVQEGNRFIVPYGEVVKGDVIIYKGILEIQGEVQGSIKTVDASIEVGPNGSHSGVLRRVDASPKAKLAVALAELWEKVKCLLTGND